MTTAVSSRPLVGTAVRVLLVEDNDGDARLAELMLEGTFGPDITLDRARTLTETIAQVRVNAPDCVVLDLGLADAEGLEGVRAIQNLAPAVAIVVLTGTSDGDLGSQAVAAGAQDYLIKGNTKDETLTRSIRYAVLRKNTETLEARLHQAQRLESLGQLAGGVAHDFNNLLCAIQNYAEFVGDEIEQLDLPAAKAETIRHDVTQIGLAVERGTALTRQLLSFGHRSVVRPELISLNDVISNVEELLRRTIGEDIELDVRLADQPTTILADSGRIEQVLMNLAVNARDAMLGGGTLSIDSSIIDVDDVFIEGFEGVESGRYVRLRVSDTGHGMTPDIMQHAFDPFYTTKAKGDGTGLGLATVYGIVTQAGGFVQLYSEVDLGTNLTALFPAADGHPVEHAVTEAATPAFGTETVLVVEDEEAMRDVTSRILRRNGYNVLVASNGPEAIELVHRYTNPIDLLLTDVVMPKMSGKEVAERVQAMRPSTRVVFMSGYAERVLTNKGTLDPNVVLVEKPFSEATILAGIREVLDR